MYEKNYYWAKLCIVSKQKRYLFVFKYMSVWQNKFKKRKRKINQRNFVAREVKSRFVLIINTNICTKTYGLTIQKNRSFGLNWNQRL